MFGKSHSQFYSTEHVTVGYLMRDTHSFIPHLPQCDLDAIVSSASTM